MSVIREKSEKKISEKVPVDGRNVTYSWEECEFIREKGEKTDKAGLKSRGLEGAITFFPSFLPIAEGYLSDHLDFDRDKRWEESEYEASYSNNSYILLTFFP